ncbi:LAGLIDADG family homing endonuclease [Patescibacteria group bacterium]|nr:LAGLIDADG family homing endonuclease [Patescibacteria group bacterium]
MKVKARATKWSSQIAYVVGLITTDGSLSVNRRTVEITSKDIQLLKTAKNCLGINNKITPKTSGYTGKKNCYRIQFGNVIFYKWLLKIGLMSNKTKKIGALKIPNKYFFDFLRGHLDGDGCIRKYQDPVYPNSQRLYIRFYSASINHLNWLQEKLNNLLKIHGYIGPGARVFSLTFAKKESLKLLTKLYPNPSIPCLQRKYKIVELILKDKPRW